MKSDGKRDPKDRSRKWCCCGSHSANDRKKSKQHHSTAARLEIREGRKIKELLRLYRKIDGCSPQTPWCKDPNYANLDHYHCHIDDKRKVMKKLYKIFEVW